MTTRVPARDLALAGLFGAAALLLPVLFHTIHLGRVFMPMYLPLVALAFLVRPRTAMATAVMVPLLSALATGMPPVYPPIAPVMAVELSLVCGAIAMARQRWPAANEWLVLVPALVTGRVLNAALMYGVGRLMGLPAEFIAGLSFLAGWPGVVLMIVVVPPLVRTVAGRRASVVHA